MTMLPPISKYLLRRPCTIHRGATLSQARDLMTEYAIWQLPVVDGGKLVGIVSERDLSLLDRFSGDRDLTVDQAMSADVYVAGTDDPLDAILDQMAEQHLGSIVVLDRYGDVEGIFTTVDAMRALVDVLEQQPPQ